MIGPRIEESGNSDIVMFGSSNSEELSEPRAKRKLYGGPLAFINNEENENICAKRRHTDDNIDNEELPTRLEVVVVNGKWDTSQTIPSIIAEMHSVNLQDLDVVNEFCIPWSESSGTEISIEDDNSIFKQTAVMDSDLEYSGDSQSASGESTPLTVHSDADIRNSTDSENCDENLSWLINFKVGLPKYQNYDVCEAGSKSAKNVARCGRMFLSDSNVNVRKLQSTPQKSTFTNRYTGPKKPPFTYTELIEQALQEKGELTVSGIYHWISEHFPFYKANDDRWKNSVRHNLSINPHFRKGCKASHGAGHLWAIANKEELSHTSLIKKQRMQQFMSNVVTAEEVEAATASIEDNKENRDFHREVLLSITAENCAESTHYSSAALSPQEGVSLEQSAEEILSGIKKEVEVQYLIPVQEKSSKETDFLNPVSKEVVVEESGLLEKPGDMGASYLITDLNSAALGLNMGETEVISPDALFAEEIGFQYYELTSPPPQLQV
ncbi:hypothetical protein C0J52_07542 [Blattella germanica]|nr:hypothetical protein C0J52_07542 [Blattella germanica]